MRISLSVSISPASLSVSRIAMLSVSPSTRNTTPRCTRETGEESSLSRPSSVASKLPSYTTSSSHSRFSPSAIGSPPLRSPGLMWPPMPSEYCLRSRRSADARSRWVRKYLSPWWNTT